MGASVATGLHADFNPRSRMVDTRPHPDPLPQEREQQLSTVDCANGFQAIPALGGSRRRRTILPLPAGEGRGEGERIALN